MTHDDVIIFEKLKLKKNAKTNNCKNNFELPLNPAKDMNITRFTCLRFARQVSSPYFSAILQRFSTEVFNSIADFHRFFKTSEFKI